MQQMYDMHSLVQSCTPLSRNSAIAQWRDTGRDADTRWDGLQSGRALSCDKTVRIDRRETLEPAMAGTTSYCMSHQSETKIQEKQWRTSELVLSQRLYDREVVVPNGLCISEREIIWERNLIYAHIFLENCSVIAPQAAEIGKVSIER